MARRFNLPKPVAHYAQDPTAGQPGDQYYNTTDKVFKKFDGTNWVTQVPPTATNSDTIKTQSTNVAQSFYPTFVDSNNATAGYEAVYTDAGLSYNPSTNALTATTFSGIATNADNIKTIQSANASVSFYPMFVDSNNTTAGYETVYTDAGLSYNPATNALTATTFNGSLNGTVQYSDIANFTSGVISSGVVTATTGWQINSQSYIDRYGIVQLSFDVERTGSNITVGTNPTDGNIADLTVATIASGKRPVFNAIMVSGENGPVATGYITDAGSAIITATIPGDNINTSNTFTFNSTYIKA